MHALGAGVAELVDAADSKSASFTRVGVRVPSPVPFFLRKYASFLASATECQINLAFFRLTFLRVDTIRISSLKSRRKKDLEKRPFWSLFEWFIPALKGGC